MRREVFRGDVTGVEWPDAWTNYASDHIRMMGTPFRETAALPLHLRELAILTVAAEWRAQVPWWAHVPLAEQSGTDPASVAAVREGREPPNPDDAAVYRFCRDLLARRRPTPEAMAAMTALVGEEATAELVCMVGFYAALAITFHAYGISVPPGVTTPFAEA